MRKKIVFTIITVTLFLGLMCGCHKSADDITPVTRGEWLSMLAEGFGLDTAGTSSTPYFEDIPVGHELYGTVQGLSNWNILAPYTENKLDVGKTVTRQEVAATAAIAAGYRAEGNFEIEQAAQFAARHSILDITAQGDLTREECQTALEAAQRVYLESPGEEEITVVFNEELVNLTALLPGTIQAQGNTVYMPNSISSSIYQDDTGKPYVMLTTPSGEISLGEGMTFITSSTQRNLQAMAYKVVSLADGENGTVIIKTEAPTLGDLYDELVVHTTVSLGPGNIFWEEGINAISVEGADHLSTGAEEYHLVLLGGHVEQGTYQECEHVNYFQNTWKIGPFGSNTVKGATGISNYIKNGPAADALCNSGYSYIDIPGIHDFNGNTESWEKALEKRKSFEAGFQISGTISLDITATTDVEYHKLDIFNHEIHLWPESASLSINSNIVSDLKIEGILEGKYKLGEILIPIGASGLSVNGALFLHVTANGTAELTAEFSNWQKAEWSSKAEEYRQDNAKQTSLTVEMKDFALDLAFGAGVSADLYAASIKLIGTEVTIDGELVSTGSVVGNCEEETIDGVTTRNYTEALRFGADLYAPIVSLTVSGPEHLSDILGLEHTWDLIGRDNTHRWHLWDDDFVFWNQTTTLGEISETEPADFDFSEFVGTYTPLPSYKDYYGEAPPDITLDKDGIIIGAKNERGTNTFIGTAPISVKDYGQIHCLLWESPPNETDGAFSESYTIYPIGVPISNPYGNPRIQDDTSKVRIHYELAKGGVWDMYYIKLDDPSSLDEDNVETLWQEGSTDKLTAQLQTNGNNINGPRLVELDGMLYFFMPDGVHRMKEDGSENVLIYELPRAEGERVIYRGETLAIADDWLYIRRSQNLSRVKTDGTELQEIADLGKITGTITAVDDWLYIGSTHKLKLDGSEFQEFHKPRSASGYTFNISDGWVYCYDGNGIFKLKPDGTQKEEIRLGRADYMIVDGEWIYYCKLFGDNSIYKMKTDGSANELLLPLKNSIRALNLSDGWLYYAARGEGGKNYLYRVKTDGTDNQALYTNENFLPDEIYILKGWLYIVDRGGCLYRMMPDGTEAQLIAEWAE